MPRADILVLGLVALAACATSEPVADSAAGSERDAGGDAGRDAGRDASQGKDAGAKPGRVRVWVPDPDCSDNDPEADGDGVIVERCECAALARRVCCANAGQYECTDFVWSAVPDARACPSGDTAAAEGADDAGDDSPLTFECRACERGTEGCFCRPDDTCDTGLLCVETFCGRPDP